MGRHLRAAGTGVPVAATVAVDPDGAVLGALFTVVEYVDGLAVRSAEDSTHCPMTTSPATVVGH